MLNRPNPDQVARSIEMIAEITLEPRTIAETRGGINGMSAGKTPCMDSIKEETSTLNVYRLHNSLGKVWL